MPFKMPFKFWPKRISPSPNLIDENSSRHSDSIESKKTDSDILRPTTEENGDKNKPDEKEKKSRKGVFACCGLLCLLLLLLLILLLLLLLILLLVFGLGKCLKSLNSYYKILLITYI